jgi:ArsR family transcriptional regulator
MDDKAAVFALGALAQDTRLATFRLLVRHEPAGLPAGEIGRQIDVPQNTMSAHLAILARVGRVRAERHGRSIIYRADLDTLRQMSLFLLADCCGGRADVCEPVIANLLPYCAATKAKPMD